MLARLCWTMLHAHDTVEGRDPASGGSSCTELLFDFLRERDSAPPTIHSPTDADRAVFFSTLKYKVRSLRGITSIQALENAVQTGADCCP